MMVTVGVAGGSGGLGLTIVETLKADSKHEVVILSRKNNPELEKKLRARVIAVDYKDIQSVVSILEVNNIDTVICTINSHYDLESERNLIHAADKSRTTRRIIPSIFAGFTYPMKYPTSSPVSKAKYEAIKEVEKTSLEYTLFYNGMFLDYYGSPYFKSNVQPFPMFVDILHESAAIPGSGNELIVFTHTSDLAKFVVMSLDLEEWPKESYVIGEKHTWNEFVKLAEESKGSKFKVSYDSKADLKAGRISELPSYPAMFDGIPEVEYRAIIATAGLWSAEGELDLKPAHTLNNDFSEVKTIGVKRFLELSWKGH